MTITLGNLRSFLQDLRGCWKQKFLKKKLPLQWGKIYGTLFPLLSSVTNLKGQIARVLNFFHHYYVSYNINSLGPRRLLKTHFFERKANFPVKKSFWPNPPPIIECDKPQGTVYISSEASVTISLEKLRSFLQDLRGCWKHNFLKKKKGNPSSEEKNWAVFSRIFEFDKPQGTVFKGTKFSLTITVEVIASFLQDLRGCWKHNFLKKNSKIPVRKSFWPVFLSYVRVWQTSGDGLC